jgi:hypothetical protein
MLSNQIGSLYICWVVMYKRERGFERIVIDGVEHDSGLVVLHRQLT